jgi:hypothetical protein
MIRRDTFKLNIMPEVCIKKNLEGTVIIAVKEMLVY